MWTQSHERPPADSSVSGSRFRANASPSLAHLVRGAAEDVPHPTKPGLSLWDATKDSGVFRGAVNDEVLEMYDAEQQQADDLGVTPLGSGSDYTVFLQRIGVCLAFLIDHENILIYQFRLRVPMADSAVHPTILLITTILCTTLNGGRSCMVILDSSGMCVMSVRFMAVVIYNAALGRYCKTSWDNDSTFTGLHRLAFEHNPLCSRTGRLS